MPFAFCKPLLQKLIPFLGYHHVVIAFLVVVIVAISIIVAGCTFHGLANIYLLSLSYPSLTDSIAVAAHPEQVNSNVSAIFSNITTHSSLEVRVGYLGLCMRQKPDKWQCSGSATSLASIVELSSTNSDDPLNLIWIASNFRQQIVFVGLIIIAAAFCFFAILSLLSFPGWHTEPEENETGSEREVKPFPSKMLSYLATALLGFGFIFVFVSMLWQHIASAAAASMVGSLTYGTAKGVVGPAAMALGWAAVFCQFVAFAAIVILVLSIKVLRDAFD